MEPNEIYPLMNEIYDEKGIDGLDLNYFLNKFQELSKKTNSFSKRLGSNGVLESVSYPSSLHSNIALSSSNCLIQMKNLIWKNCELFFFDKKSSDESSTTTTTSTTTTKESNTFEIDNNNNSNTDDNNNNNNNGIQDNSSSEALLGFLLDLLKDKSEILRAKGFSFLKDYIQKLQINSLSKCRDTLINQVIESFCQMIKSSSNNNSLTNQERYLVSEALVSIALAKNDQNILIKVIKFILSSSFKLEYPKILKATFDNYLPIESFNYSSIIEQSFDKTITDLVDFDQLKLIYSMVYQCGDIYIHCNLGLLKLNLSINNNNNNIDNSPLIITVSNVKKEFHTSPNINQSDSLGFYDCDPYLCKSWMFIIGDRLYMRSLDMGLGVICVLDIKTFKESYLLIEGEINPLGTHPYTMFQDLDKIGILEYSSGFSQPKLRYLKIELNNNNNNEKDSDNNNNNNVNIVQESSRLFNIFNSQQSIQFVNSSFQSIDKFNMTNLSNIKSIFLSQNIIFYLSNDNNLYYCGSKYNLNSNFEHKSLDAGDIIVKKVVFSEPDLFIIDEKNKLYILGGENKNFKQIELDFPVFDISVNSTNIVCIAGTTPPSSAAEKDKEKESKNTITVKSIDRFTFTLLTTTSSQYDDTVPESIYTVKNGFSLIDKNRDYWVSPGYQVFNENQDSSKTELVFTGYENVVLVNEKGDVYTNGSNEFGQLGLGHYNDVLVTTYQKLKLPFEVNKKTKFFFGQTFTLALSSDQQLYYSGKIKNVRSVNTFTLFNENINYLNERIVDIATSEFGFAILKEVIPSNYYKLNFSKIKVYNDSNYFGILFNQSNNNNQQQQDKQVYSLYKKSNLGHITTSLVKVPSDVLDYQLSNNLCFTFKTPSFDGETKVFKIDILKNQERKDITFSPNQILEGTIIDGETVTDLIFPYLLNQDKSPSTIIPNENSPYLNNLKRILFITNEPVAKLDYSSDMVVGNYIKVSKPIVIHEFLVIGSDKKEISVQIDILASNGTKIKLSKQKVNGGRYCLVKPWILLPNMAYHIIVNTDTPNYFKTMNNINLEGIQFDFTSPSQTKASPSVIEGFIFSPMDNSQSSIVPSYPTYSAKKLEVSGFCELFDILNNYYNQYSGSSTKKIQQFVQSFNLLADHVDLLGEINKSDKYRSMYGHVYSEFIHFIHNAFFSQSIINASAIMTSDQVQVIESLCRLFINSFPYIYTTDELKISSVPMLFEMIENNNVAQDEFPGCERVLYCILKGIQIHLVDKCLDPASFLKLECEEDCFTRDSIDVSLITFYDKVSDLLFRTLSQQKSKQRKEKVTLYKLLLDISTSNIEFNKFKNNDSCRDDAVKISCKDIATNINQWYIVSHLKISAPKVSEEQPKLSQVTRMKHSKTFWSFDGQSVDGISFKASESVYIYGIGVYGDRGGYTCTATYNFGHQADRFNHNAVTTSWRSNALQYIHHIFFKQPVHLPASQYLTLFIKLRGPNCSSGSSGKVLVVSDGITFEFTSADVRNDNGTSVHSGQIPIIFFSKNIFVNQPKRFEIESIKKSYDISIDILKYARDNLDILLNNLLSSKRDDRYVVLKESFYQKLLPMAIDLLNSTLNIELKSKSSDDSNDESNAASTNDNNNRISLLMDIYLQITSIHSRFKKENQYKLIKDQVSTTTSSGPQLVRVESNHPYEDTVKQIQDIVFPEQVKWMVIQFDSRSKTCQKSDKLIVWYDDPSNNNSGVGERIAVSPKGFYKKFPTEAFIIPGNKLYFDFQSASLPLNENIANKFGFACNVFGYEIIPSSLGLNSKSTESTQYPLYNLETQLAFYLSMDCTKNISSQETTDCQLTLKSGVYHQKEKAAKANKDKDAAAKDNKNNDSSASENENSDDDDNKDKDNENSSDDDDVPKDAAVAVADDSDKESDNEALSEDNNSDSDNDAEKEKKDKKDKKKRELMKKITTEGQNIKYPIEDFLSTKTADLKSAEYFKKIWLYLSDQLIHNENVNHTFKDQLLNNNNSNSSSSSSSSSNESFKSLDFINETNNTLGEEVSQFFKTIGYSLKVPVEANNVKDKEKEKEKEKEKKKKEKEKEKAKINSPRKKSAGGKDDGVAVDVVGKKDDDKDDNKDNNKEKEKEQVKPKSKLQLKIEKLQVKFPSIDIDGDFDSSDSDCEASSSNKLSRKERRKVMIRRLSNLLGRKKQMDKLKVRFKDLKQDVVNVNDSSSDSDQQSSSSSSSSSSESSSESSLNEDDLSDVDDIKKDKEEEEAEEEKSSVEKEDDKEEEEEDVNSSNEKESITVVNDIDGDDEKEDEDKEEEEEKEEEINSSNEKESISPVKLMVKKIKEQTTTTTTTTSSEVKDNKEILSSYGEKNTEWYPFSKRLFLHLVRINGLEEDFIDVIYRIKNQKKSLESCKQSDQLSPYVELWRLVQSKLTKWADSQEVNDPEANLFLLFNDEETTDVEEKPLSLDKLNFISSFYSQLENRNYAEIACASNDASSSSSSSSPLITGQKSSSSSTPPLGPNGEVREIKYSFEEFMNPNNINTSQFNLNINKKHGDQSQLPASSSKSNESNSTSRLSLHTQQIYSSMRKNMVKNDITLGLTNLISPEIEFINFSSLTNNNQLGVNIKIEALNRLTTMIEKSVVPSSLENIIWNLANTLHSTQAPKDSLPEGWQGKVAQNLFISCKVPSFLRNKFFESFHRLLSSLSEKVKHGNYSDAIVLNTLSCFSMFLLPEDVTFVQKSEIFPMISTILSGLHSTPSISSTSSSSNSNGTEHNNFGKLYLNSPSNFQSPKGKENLIETILPPLSNSNISEDNNNSNNTIQIQQTISSIMSTNIATKCKFVLSKNPEMMPSLFDETTNTFWEAPSGSNIEITFESPCPIREIALYIDNTNQENAVHSIKWRYSGVNIDTPITCSLNLNNKSGWVSLPFDNKTSISNTTIWFQKMSKDDFRLRQLKILADDPEKLTTLKSCQVSKFDATISLLKLLSFQIFGIFNHKKAPKNLKSQISTLLTSNPWVDNIQKQIFSMLSSEVQKVISHLCDVGGIELSAEEISDQNNYLVELLSTLLSLLESEEGKSLIPSKSLICSMIPLIHRGSVKVQQVILSIFKLLIINIKPIIFDDIIKELYPGLSSSFTFCEFLLACISKSVVAQFKSTSEFLSFDKVCTIKALDGEIPIENSLDLIALVKSLISKSTSWKESIESTIKDIFINRIKKEINQPPNLLITSPNFWYTLASLMVISNDPEFINMINNDNVDSSTIKTCQNHDDGTTEALVFCSNCQLNLCNECDRFLHLPKNNRNHSKSTLENQLLTIEVREFCVRLKISSSLFVLDNEKLKAIIQTVNPHSLDVCRFCKTKLELENLLPSHGISNVCSSKECKTKAAESCPKIHTCGHCCYGIRKENECLPCLHGCKNANANEEQQQQFEKKLTQDVDDMCMICWTEGLSEAPSIQLECGHVFHHGCTKTLLESRWTGSRITFGFAQCPICKSSIKHQSLKPLTDEIDHIRNEIIRKGKLRIDYHNMNNDPLLKSGGRYQDRVEDFIMEQFAYYLCFKCKQPYFGGTNQCAAGVAQPNNFNPEELICGACSAGDCANVCNKHGKDYLEFKCRYCCSVAIWFCFGTTHFCEQCHNRNHELSNKKDHPKCPVAPGGYEMAGDECPLHVDHPETGKEFALGCGICRNVKEF